MANLIHLVFTYFFTVSIVLAQTIYVDRDTGYYDLPCCAQLPISIAVRDMSQGCGDTGRLTSYDCFCTTSSSYFSSLISSEVLTGCSNSSALASQAISVFNSYCAVGANGTQATAPATAGTSNSCAASTSLASPASGLTTSLPTATSAPTATGPPPANTSTKSSVAWKMSTGGILSGLCFIIWAVTL